ncbi:MAG: glutamyl-tRNA reductase [Thermodesulfovibrionales bacterium]|nr:glutamyl-tRNA reductase [Thermodesulfovibrionales bacterium]
MAILVLGLNHKTASVDIRERLAFSPEKLEKGLYDIKQVPDVKEVAILSTCNRVEIYLHVNDNSDVFRDIEDVLSNLHQIQKEQFTNHLYRYEGFDAVRHVFRVASSLDSMVIGEPQILGQIKEAFETALKKKTTGVVLNKLLSSSISTAKRVRTETKIAENAVSISFAAVELAKKIFSTLKGKMSLLIGAGEMAELAAKHLINNGVDKVTVTNRTYERACALAKDLDGKAIRFENLHDELIKVDIVICSTAAPTYILTKEDFQKIMKQRRNKPIFIIDISVPRNIDPEINSIDNVYLYDVDDLQDVVDTNMQNRKAEAKKAEDIVLQEVEKFMKWLNSLEVVPTIVELRRHVERIRDDEFEKLRHKLGHLDDSVLKDIHYMTTAIINKIMHPSIVSLKENPEESKTLLALVRRVYGLDG